MIQPNRRQRCIQRTESVGIWVMVRRLAGVLLLVSLVPGPSKAVAEVGAPTPTVQAVAADATWLAYTPPPEHPGIVCMVDSGVDPNPDTEAAVIGGQAIAPETETNDEIARLEPRAQPGNHPNGHGTLMAMMMAAPINGWGMVGIAPTSVRVYNMKALSKGETKFPFSYYAEGIEACRRQKQSPFDSSINTVNLSLGDEATPGSGSLAILGNSVTTAQRSGIAVVAAAGNEGGPVLYPAAYPSILSVGADDAGSTPGTLCSFSSRGEGLDVIAPGCDSLSGGLEGAFEDDGSPAFGSGSSQASAIVSAVLASIRAYAPQLTYVRAEECLTTTANHGSIDAAAAFDACDLSQVVEEGRAAEQVALEGSRQKASIGPGSGTNQPMPTGACTPSISCGQPLASGSSRLARCPRPRGVSVANRQGHLVVWIHRRPDGCLIEARLLVKNGRRYMWRNTPSRPSTTIVVPNHRLRRIQIRFSGGAANMASSSWITVKAP